MKAEETIDDKIFDFVYGLAMRDATMRRAYEGGKSTLVDSNEAKKTVHDYIKAILKGCNPSFYNCAAKVKSCFKNDPQFSFGNTQKVINMTAKYMYITTYGENKTARNHFAKCHCPMDSYMMRCVIDKINEIDNGFVKFKKWMLGHEVDPECIIDDMNWLDYLNSHDEGSNSEKCNWEKYLSPRKKNWGEVRWSKIDESSPDPSNNLGSYVLFQLMVRFLIKDEVEINPIDFDYKLWS